MMSYLSAILSSSPSPCFGKQQNHLTKKNAHAQRTPGIVTTIIYGGTKHSKTGFSDILLGKSCSHHLEVTIIGYSIIYQV